MKKIYLLILLINFITKSYSQSYEVRYNINQYELVFPKSLETTPSFDSIKESFDNAKEYVKEVDFELKTTNLISVFEGKKGLAPPNDNFNTVKVIISMLGLRGYIYSDYENKIQLTDKEVMGEKFVIKKQINNKKWTLTQEQSTILGKTCFLAKSKDSIINSKGVFIRDVKAYYTKEIQVNSGPGNYCGLPGLILKVVITSDNLNYSLKATSIKEIESFKAKQPKGKAINEEELNELIAMKKSF